MKFLVNEMPYWETDCPFFNPSNRECELSHLHCNYMERPAGERKPDECDYLQEASKNEC